MSLNPWLGNPLYLEIVKEYSSSDDFTIRTLLLFGEIEGVLLFCDGSVDSASVSAEILFPLTSHRLKGDSPDQLFKQISNCCCSITVQQGGKQKAIEAVAYGNIVLLADGHDKAIILEARPKTIRAITEPSSENITKGAKDGLNEQLKTNLSLIRKRLSTPDLQVKTFTVGQRSATDISLISLRGVVNPDCLRFVTERLEGLCVDCITSLGVVEEALREGDGLFPQTLSLERPDRICAHINEGCVAILVDGFPYALVGPVSILHHMATADDYARHHMVASAIRIMRYVLLLIALMLPPFYISISTYHQEMLPTKLAATIIRTRLDVPFNDLIETIVLLFAFEILVEAGLRIPKNIGQTVSIVGGLIVGEAAVNAKLISPVVVIVVALAVIATFTIPDQDFSNAVRLSRLVLCLLSSLLGLAGMTLGMIILTLYLFSSRSFGVPYMAPLSHTSPGTRDTFRRQPFSRDLERPAFLGVRDAVRRHNTHTERTDKP